MEIKQMSVNGLPARMKSIRSAQSSSRGPLHLPVHLLLLGSLHLHAPSVQLQPLKELQQVSRGLTRPPGLGCGLIFLGASSRWPMGREIEKEINITMGKLHCPLSGEAAITDGVIRA